MGNGARCVKPRTVTRQFIDPGTAIGQASTIPVGSVYLNCGVDVKSPDWNAIVLQLNHLTQKFDT